MQRPRTHSDPIFTQAHAFTSLLAFLRLYFDSYYFFICRPFRIFPYNFLSCRLRRAFFYRSGRS